MEQRPVDCLEESLGEQSFLPENEVHREAERAWSCSEDSTSRCLTLCSRGKGYYIRSLMTKLHAVRALKA
jgi:hypothetical protein